MPTSQTKGVAMRKVVWIQKKNKCIALAFQKFIRTYTFAFSEVLFIEVVIVLERICLTYLINFNFF